MIKAFRHKGLKDLYRTGSVRGVAQAHVTRLRAILARLEVTRTPADVQLPGLGLHRLKGALKGYWAVQVSGNWRVIFRFDGDDVTDVDYLDYH